MVCATVMLFVAAGIFLLTFPDASSLLIGNLAPVSEKIQLDPSADIDPQKPLAIPPHPIKAIYLTSWSAGSSNTVDRAISLIGATELNAVVIDIKDYTGMVSYRPDVAQVLEYGSFENRIKRINAMIKLFHDSGIYVIGRIAVFQDPQLVRARPEFALRSKKTGRPWGDAKGITWLDAAAPAVWDYNLEIAKDVLARGFDEVNFDYIRFPTDGDLGDVQYAFYNPATEQKHQVIQDFLKHARQELPSAKISIDIFGETTFIDQDSGIGQKFEDGFLYVDAVSPMIYPSHFGKGFIGFANPAAYPYEVVKYVTDKSFAKMKALTNAILKEPVNSTSTMPAAPPAIAELRPWLQDFDLGVDYDAVKVRAQITALNDSARAAAGCPSSIKNQQEKLQLAPCPQGEIGWMLWSAANSYTRAALAPQ